MCVISPTITAQLFTLIKYVFLLPGTVQSTTDRRLKLLLITMATECDQLKSTP